MLKWVSWICYFGFACSRIFWFYYFGGCNFCLPGWLLIFVHFGCLGCLICVGFEFVQISWYVDCRSGFWITGLWVSGYGCFVDLFVLLLWVCFLGVLACLVIMYCGVWVGICLWI